MRFFIISLPDAMERRRRVASMMATSEASFEFVDAVAGADIENTVSQFCPRRYCPRLRYNLSLNEIACCLSHRAALIRFLETDHLHGIVLEDDAHIEPPNFQILKTISFTAMAFDILKLGGTGSPRGRLIQRSAGVDLLAVEKPTMGAYGYAVSRAGARKLIAAALPVKHQYDSYIRHGYMHGCTIFETSPHLIDHDDCGKSDIGARQKSDPEMSLAKIAISTAWQLTHNIRRLEYRIRKFGFARL